MSDVVAVKDAALLNFHLEPDEPLEIAELTKALGSIARQYQIFAAQQGVTGKLAEGRLLVSSVKPGSIDINLLPDYQHIAAMVPMVPLLFDRYEMLVKFAERLRGVLDFFLGKEGPQASIQDCDDATNIAGPIASHGGHQTFNVYNGRTTVNILTVDTEQARKIIEGANARRLALAPSIPEPERRQRTPLVWRQLARDAAKTEGVKSPDKGVIQEIDSVAHPVFFTDEMAYLKKEMIDDEENPYQKVFYVDVEIARLPGGRVGNYRITGFHGKDDMPCG